MKTKLLLLSGVAMMLVGCSCSNTDTSKVELYEKDTIVRKDLYFLDPDNGNVTSELALDVLYRAEKEEPYISMDNAAQVLDLFRKAKGGSSLNVKVENNGNKSTLKNENGATAVVDGESQTITFADMDKFLIPTSQPTLYMYTIPSGVKSVKVSNSSFEKGSQVVIDLKKYSQISIINYSGKNYLPVQTFSDLFLSIIEGNNIAYNMHDLYLLTDVSTLETNALGLKGLTSLGKKFFNGPKLETVSSHYSEFFYQSLLLNYDYGYVLKTKKSINSFDEFFSNKGYKNDLISGNVKIMDTSLAYGLSTLRDAHTAFTASSPLYDYGTMKVDQNQFDKQYRQYIVDGEEFAKEKVEKGIKEGLEIDQTNGIAYISFNNFTEIDEQALYSLSSLNNKDIVGNTQTLFAHAYKTITSSANKGKVKYVVVDLTSNDGGFASSLLYGLGTLIGDINTYMMNGLSGSHSAVSYKVDINADGKIDSNDKSLSELGYKVCFLDSRFSFSSGNAMPILAKQNNSNVVLLGQKTGGGTCSVRLSNTAIGSSFNQSSVATIVTKNGSTYSDVEEGINPDVEIEESKLTDRAYVASVLGRD